MVERSFLITLDDSVVCDYYRYSTLIDNYCTKSGIKCTGDINNRPNWCLLSPADDLVNKIKELEEHLDTFCKCPSHGPSLIHFNGVD